MNPPVPPDTGRIAAEIAEAAARQRRGDHAGAERQLAALLQAAPMSAAAHKAMAALAAGSQRLPLALQHMRTAAALAPQAAPVQVEFGCLLAFAGQLQASLEPFAAATTLAPSSADGWHFLGVTLARLQRDAEALPALRRAWALAPERTPTLQALAAAEFRVGFPADALPLWRELARRRPDDDDVVLKLGETLSRLGRDADAVQCFRDALQRRPDAADLWMALGQAEEDSGRRDAAAGAYERALALQPGWAFPLAGLLGLRRGGAADEHVALARTLQAGELADPARALLGYEMGKVLDARGDWAGAMASWDDANAARRRMIGEFDAPAIRRRGDQIVADHDAALFAAGPYPGSRPDPRPLFVVGMPRSGTTLTEQILSAHPQAFGCGELAELGLIAANLPLREGAVRAWPARPQDRHPDALAWAVPRWLEAATRRAPADAQRLVDKSPMNFQLLGLAALMFPQARVVWCRRDPRDIAVSIYGENFSLDERFATGMAGIGHFINLQERLMRHWQAVLPLPILELDYEDLVADHEAQSRRLVDFAGLPWDPACLRFHQSERGVQTPSRWQVRQPVHSRSVGRWRHYAPALAPLLDVLESPPAGD